MNFKKAIPAILFLMSVYSLSAQNKATISNKDLTQLLGSWQGTLTYLDYSSNKPYTMPADINIRRIGKTNKYIFANSYPKEPNANSNDTVTVSKNGRMMNEETVKSKQRLPNGKIEIVTTLLSTDGNENKPALIRHTYTIGKKDYTNQKDVQFIGATNWIKRNEYTYTRQGDN